MTPDDKKWVRLLLHDLRNPLAEIQTGIQIRKMRNENTETESFLDDSILASVKRMSLLMDLVQLTVNSRLESESSVDVSIFEILSHFPFYLGRKEPGLLQSCVIDPFQSSQPVQIIPGVLNLVLTGLILFADHVKMENSVIQLTGKLNHIYLSWKDSSPEIYTNVLFTESGQVELKTSQHSTGLCIPLISANYAIKDLMKGSISFLDDQTDFNVTILISFPLT